MTGAEAVSSRTARSLRRNRNFVRLFAADMLSQFGAEILPVALPLVAVISLRASAFQVGLLAAFQTLPFLVVGLPVGAWVDRSSRHRILVLANVVRAATLAALPLAWWLGWLTIAQLLIVALVVGIGTVFFDTAYQSYLPVLVSRGMLVRGNSWLQAVQSVAQVGGPGAAGFLVQAVTAPVAVAVAVFGYSWSAVCIGTIRAHEPIPRRAERRHIGREILAGLRFVSGQQLLWRIIVCTSMFNLFWSIGTPMFVLLLARDLKLNAGLIGLVLASGGVGGIVGALIADRVVRVLGEGRTIWISVAAAGIFGALLPLAQPGWQLLLPAAGQFFAGIGIVVYNVSQVSFRQAITPDHLLGRMSATARFLVWGVMPIGGLLSGIIGTVLGARATLWVAALGATVSFMWILLSPIPSMRQLPRLHDPAAGAVL